MGAEGKRRFGPDSEIEDHGPRDLVSEGAVAAVVADIEEEEIVIGVVVREPDRLL